MKRFPQRRPKNYQWMAVMGQGQFDTTDVATASLFNSSDWNNASQQLKAHCNIRRLLIDAVVQINDTKLHDSTSDTWGPWAWMVYIADADDDTAYDPTSGIDLAQETVLAHGLENSIGWGTINDIMVAGSGSSTTQTAAFMASAKLHIDIRSNRRLTTDQSIRMAFTRSTINDDMNSESTEDYELCVMSRCLIQIP